MSTVLTLNIDQVVMENANDIEIKLDEADYISSISNIRYNHDEVFTRLKEGIHE